MLTDAEKVQVQKEVSSSYEMGSVEEEAILKVKTVDYLHKEKPNLKII